MVGGGRPGADAPFEALADCAGADVILDDAAHVGEVEVTTKAVKGALDALMTVVVYRGQNLL